jgi:hypothetical protein
MFSRLLGHAGLSYQTPGATPPEKVLPPGLTRPAFLVPALVSFCGNAAMRSGVSSAALTRVRNWLRRLG